MKRVGLLAEINNSTPIRLYMDFFTRMFVTPTVEGNCWDWVVLIDYPREVRHLRIKEGSPSPISDTRRPKRDAFDSRARRQIKFHEQRIELRKRSAK
jgi:hypothetical protein